MAGNGHGRPGSAGFKYRHGWIPVAGSGAVDKRSKKAQRKTPSAPPNPAATPSHPTASPADAPKKPKGGGSPYAEGYTPPPAPRRFEGVSKKELDKYEKMYQEMSQANDLAPDMRSSVTKALEDIKAERQHRNRKPVAGMTTIDPLEPDHGVGAGTHNRADLKPGSRVVVNEGGHELRGTVSHEPSAHNDSVIVDLDPGEEGPDGDFRVETHVSNVESQADVNESRGADGGIGGGTHNRPDLFPGRAVYANVDGERYRGTISTEPSAHDGEVIVELDPGVEGPDGDFRIETHTDNVDPAGARPTPANDPFAARMASEEMNVQSNQPSHSGGDLTEPGTRVTTDVPGYGRIGATVVDGEPVFPDNVMLELDEEGPNGDYMLEVNPKDLKSE